MLVLIDTPSAGQIYGGAVAAPVFKRIMTAALQYLGIRHAESGAAGDDHDVDGAAARPQATLIPAIAEVGGRSLMPDVRGMAMRDAARARSVGLSVRPPATAPSPRRHPNLAKRSSQAAGAPYAQLRRARATGHRRHPEMTLGELVAGAQRSRPMRVRR